MKNLKIVTDFVINLGESNYRAKQIFDGVFKQFKENLSEIKQLPTKFSEKVSKNFKIYSIKKIKHLVSSDQTVEKALFELETGQLIEAVLMKYKDGRNTICISSQAGCQMGCKFCATGTLKFGRSLTSEEIFDQVLYFHQYLGRKGESVSNIVYMGMGEPFMNYENVIESARMMNTPEFLNLGSRRITISTSGIASGIEKMAEIPEQYNLAISLHAPLQSIREKIMPVAKMYILDKLTAALETYLKKTGRRVTFEYVMLENINDTEECAAELSKIAKNKLIHVNLIPYNFTGIEGISGTKKDNLQKFKKILQMNGVNVTIRKTMGQDIDAACGQLANKQST